MIDFYLETKLFETDILSFALPSNHPNAAALAEDRILYFEGRKFFIYSVEDDHALDGTAVKRVFAEESWMRLADKVEPDSYVLEATPGDGLAELLSPYGWKVLDLTGDSNVYPFEASNASVLNICWQWANITSTELKFYSSNNYVVIAPRVGVTLTYEFRYGKNIESIKRTITPPEVTRLYAYGRNDLDISGETGGPTYIEDYSYYTNLGLTFEEAQANYQKDDIWTDTAFTDSTALYQAAQARLALLSQPQYTYEMSVVDLANIVEVNEGDYDTGDTVWVADDAINLSGQARVSRRIRYPYEPHRDVVELSFGGIPLPSTTASDRLDTTVTWNQFIGPISANYLIRNDATWTVARIPLRYIEDAKYHMGIDLGLTGRGGTGMVTIQIYDNTDALVVKEWNTTYADGVETRISGSFAQEYLSGSHEYRLRVSVAADGGPDPSNGVDLTIEVPEENDIIAWWMMVRGATRETPPLGESSIEYFYSGGPGFEGNPAGYRQFIVPDNVTEVTIRCEGEGCDGNGRGGRVTATFPVTPGEQLDVIIGEGGSNDANYLSTHPNGGNGSGPTGNRSTSGGGSSQVVRGLGDTTPAAFFALTLNQIMILAPGGGALSNSGTPGVNGIGGFFKGGDGTLGFGNETFGLGATQYSGGAGGGDASTDGSWLKGGDAAWSTSSFSDLGQGGGGGLYGGGASGNAGSGGGSTKHGAGGGSGWVDPSGYDIIVEDGVVAKDTASVLISWVIPEIA